MKFDPTAPEFANPETFAQYLLDDDRTTFFPGEAQAVSIATKTPMVEVTKELLSYGFKVMTAEVQRTIRGFNSNPNGTHPFQENPTFTTPSGSNIMGFAGHSGR